MIWATLCALRDDTGLEATAIRPVFEGMADLDLAPAGYEQFYVSTTDETSYEPLYVRKADDSGWEPFQVRKPDGSGWEDFQVRKSNG
jgi:hypothetical protein